MSQQIYTYLQEKGYSNIQLIGQGGISQIFKVNKQDEVFAIKILTSQTMSGQKNYYEKNEIEVSSCLAELSKTNSCQYITKIYNVFQENGYTFIVCEYCEQGDLYNFIQRCHQYLNQFTFAVMMKQIIEGIHYLHQIKIIHRDLKPENILVTQKNGDYILKITDFGISSQENLTKSQVGTINYMAPEIIRNQQYSYEVDIWSFGCICYEIISNEQLFNAHSQFEIAKKIIEFKKFENKHFNFPELFHIIDQCLQVDPRKRINSYDIISNLNNIINKSREIPQDLSDIYSQYGEEIDSNNSEDEILNKKQSDINIQNQNQLNQSFQSNKSKQPLNPYTNTISICNQEAAQELNSQKIVEHRCKQENILPYLKQYSITDKIIEGGTLYYILYQIDLQKPEKEVLINFIFLLYTIIKGDLIKLNEFSDHLNLTQNSEEQNQLDLLHFCLINCIFTEKQIEKRFEYLIKDLLRKKALQQAIQQICKNRSVKIIQYKNSLEQRSDDEFQIYLKQNIPYSKTIQLFNFFKSQIFSKKFLVFGTIMLIGGFSYYYYYYYQGQNSNLRKNQTN
ncbi:hypothetical protein ABPG72_021060 [Tetrahymena utriculariae]